MAEASILINDQIGGKAVAMRSAYDLDVDDNPRAIQLFDMASRKPIFNKLYSAEGVETSAQVTRGDVAKIVVSVKTAPVFTDIFLQIHFSGLYGYDEEKFAVKQLHFMPDDVKSDTDGAAYLLSEPFILELAGASKITIRAWGTGFNTDTGFYVYSGLI